MERGSSNTLNANPVKDKGKSKDLKGGASCSAEVIVDQCIDVMFICSEWGSSRGGLSTFNRELAVNLAKYSKERIRVHCFVCQSTEEERQDASSNGIHLITAQRPPGFSDPLEWIRFPPSELPNPDIIVGHGRKFGGAAYSIRRITGCKWIHFVHVFCEDLGKYKLECSVTADAIADNEAKNKRELELCKASDSVVAVGSLLQGKYQRSLSDFEVEVITPGIFEKYVNPTARKSNKFESSGEDEFRIFMFGRGSFEDFELKGYDIIGKAVASLERKFQLTFVGAPQDQQRKIEKWFLEETKITRNQLTIRGFCNYEEMREMFRQADVVVMPSRTEGFGLVALEAISAGAPVLVSRECGIAKALQTVDGGMAVVIPSASPEEWAKKIQELSQQTPDERYASALHLRGNYGKRYHWKEECEKFMKMILQLAPSPTPKETVFTEKAPCSSNDKEQTQRKEVFTGTGDLPHSGLEVGKRDGREQSESAPDQDTSNKTREESKGDKKKVQAAALDTSSETREQTQGDEGVVQTTAKQNVLKTEETKKNLLSGFLQSIACKFRRTDKIKMQEMLEESERVKALHSSLNCEETEGNKKEESVQGAAAYVSTKQAQRNKKEVWTATEKAPNTSLKRKRTDGNEQTKSVQECGGQLAGNLKGDPDYEDHLLKLKIKAIELNDEQEKEVGDELIRYATIYFKNNKVSSGFFSVLQECYNLSMKTYGVGCLEITVQCTTLGSLKLLWRDFLSGHLDKLAEEYLVSSTIKTKLDVDIVKFKVTIKEEDYLACKTSFLQHSGAAPYDSTEKAQRNTKEVWTATEEAPNTSLKRQTSDGNEQTKSVQGAAAYDSAEQAHRNTKEVWTAAGAAAYDSAEQAERNTKEVGTAAAKLIVAGATPYDSAEQAQRNTREVWTATAHEKEEVPYYTSGKGLADDEDATVDTEGNQKTLIKSGNIGDEEDTWHLREAGASIKLNSGAIQLPLPFTCRCLLWNPKTLSPPTASDEILVSSVIELSHDGPPDLDYGESFEGLSFTVALLHRAPDLKGYEVVIKQLTDQENNEWKELKTENTWHGSETSTVPKWIFPFAQAVCAKSAVSSFAAIWRPKSFTFSRGTAVGPELTCIVPDFPDVSVQIPQSCVPFNQDFSVTIKVQEFPSSELKGEERLVGPGLYISGSQNVTLVAPVTIRIPLTLRKEKQELAELCPGELRILHCESLVERHDWEDITDQLDEPPRLLDGIVQFKVRYFSGFRPIKLIRSLLQSASGLKKFVRRLFSSSRRQHARFLTCLCETRIPRHFGLKIFCYPDKLQYEVKRHISRWIVAYIGEGISVRPVCEEEKILVSLSEAIIPQDTDKKNALQFVRFRENEVFDTDGEVCLESGMVPKVMFYDQSQKLLCNVQVLNRVIIDHEEGNDIHLVKDGVPTDCELEGLSVELAEKWEALGRRL